MCRNYRNLDFTHFIVDKANGSVFGSASENGTVYNFLIRDGSVHAQDGYQWIELEPDIAEIIRDRAENHYGRVPTYRTNRLLID